MKRTKVFLVALVFVVSIFLSFQSALAYNIAYMYGNTESDRLEIALNFLNGNFDSVTPIDADAETLPSLSELLTYNAIMVSPNHSWTYYAGRSAELGNLLADYVDAGGGLVMTTFSWQYPDQNGLHGRIIDGGYSPFTGGYSLYSFADLGSFTSHPIMEGVNEVSGFYRDAVVLSEDAQIIATWSDGFPFVAIDGGSGVVGVNLFPESYPSEISGDYAKLFVNALNWAAAHKKLKSKGTGAIIFVDGISIFQVLLDPLSIWPGNYSQYLVENISDGFRTLFKKKNEAVTPFIWANTMYDTGAVSRLSQLLENWTHATKITHGPLIVVSHSWGTVLAYLAISSNANIHVDKLITMGSPLQANPLVSMYSDEWLEAFGFASLPRPSNVDKWHNYWAKCDPISARISVADRNYQISTNYRDAGGIYPTCHGAYYEDAAIWTNVLLDAYKK